MSWLTQLFSSATSKVIDSIGNAIDKNVTNDEERDKLKNELTKEINSFKKEQLKFIATYDSEVSNRHANDMKSDSWLSKNIRPLSLAFLTIATVVLAYLTIFILDPEKVELIKPWQELLRLLLVTIYAFYFGSRGIEKVQTIRTTRTVDSIKNPKK